MSGFNVDENVIWTSPHTKERVSMSFRGNTGLTFACLYNLKTGMQVIAPLSEVDHDWRVMCEAEETKHAQTRTELAYVAQERNEYLERAETAEARVVQLEAERQGWISKLQAYDEIEQANRQLAQRVKVLSAELDSIRRELSEAFNSGDGAYRP